MYGMVCTKSTAFLNYIKWYWKGFLILFSQLPHMETTLHRTVLFPRFAQIIVYGDSKYTISVHRQLYSSNHHSYSISYLVIKHHLWLFVIIIECLCNPFSSTYDFTCLWSFEPDIIRENNVLLENKFVFLIALSIPKLFVKLSLVKLSKFQ